MSNKYLEGILGMRRKPHEVDDLLHNVPVKPEYDTELCFAIHIAFRDSILKNHKSVGVEPHEALVGGTRRDYNGKKKTISTKLSKIEIDRAGYGDDAWALVLGAWYHGLCGADPQSNQGMTDSSITNITNVESDYIDLSMSTWLPDFQYFEF